MASATAGAPGRVGEGLDQLGPAPVVDRGRGLGVEPVAGEPLGDAVDVGRQPLGAGAAGGDGVDEDVPEAVHAVLGDRGGGHDPRVGETLGLQEAAQIGDAVVDLVRGEPVDLVEDDQRDAGVPGERHDVVAVQRRVRVLLRVDHPDEQVGDRDEPVDLGAVHRLDGVVVGQVDEDEALQAGVGALQVEGAGAGVPVPLVDVEPVEQRAGAVQAPDARVGLRRHRAAHPGRRQLQPADGVEQGGLAASGAAREGDDGVLAGEPQPLAGPLQQRVGVVQDGLVEPSETRPDEPVEAVEPLDQPRRVGRFGGGAGPGRAEGRVPAGTRRRVSGDCRGGHRATSRL
ncbi:hypothetical protein LUX33_15625 [Actinomadura madurae]|uniref:hypothetical protein n=1 Tax=Actinomadura madurae TaxID=1993 RepID=UPI0020D217A1|nr:hypothetical protein [Actinomadura madurae]MCP9949685.1 hypothetical protein [Actinomadura madurae]